MSKYSPWFLPEIKPVHIGVYDVADGLLFDKPWFRFWDGERWKQGDASIYEASLTQFDAIRMGPWRGLARKPK